MIEPPDIKEDILRAVPRLRAFAISLTGNIDQADDLVQEAIVRGLSHLNKFTPGTNMQAWLLTILRNQFHTAYRKRRREVEDPDGTYAARLAMAPAQNGHLDLEDLGLPCCGSLSSSARLFCWSRVGSATRRRRKSAAWRSARSRAGSTAPAPVLLSYLALSTRRTSEQTVS